jgi:hypothetical protein
MSDCQRGFGLEIGFSDHFNTRHVGTLNYSAIANFHNLHITTAHAKYFRAQSVLTSSCLTTAPTMPTPLLPCSSCLWMAAALSVVLAPGRFWLRTRDYFNWTLAVIVRMQHPLWREEGAVVCNCCWDHPQIRVPTFYCLRFQTLPTWRAKTTYL